MPESYEMHEANDPEPGSEGRKGTPTWYPDFLPGKETLAFIKLVIDVFIAVFIGAWILAQLGTRGPFAVMRKVAPG